VMNTVYIQDNVLRHKGLKKLVEKLNARECRMKELCGVKKKTAAEKREYVNCQSHYGVTFSPYVDTVGLKEPGWIGIIKSAVYDLDPNRKKKEYNTTPNAAVMLRGSVFLPLPHVCIYHLVWFQWI
jgi:hypothetical protein